MKPERRARKNDRSVKEILLEGSGREDLVVRALQECQQAIDAGEPIDRAALLEKYSSIRDELSACLDGLELMQPFASDSKDSLAAAIYPSKEHPPTSHHPTATPPATLGDFRIVAEIGRGGMGVVYEAEQLSVGRKVALKVLPSAAMLDKKQIARFQNESRAAATLEHPHIVPVYFVGNERGVYYYAMRLIDGQDLSEVLAELRASTSDAANPTARLGQIALSLAESRTEISTGSSFSDNDRRSGRRLSSFKEVSTGNSFSGQTLADNRAVPDSGGGVPTSVVTDHTVRRPVYYQSIARLVCQIAEALDFAHANGIVHRDIKPANIMLDSTGQAWVTDFGLARLDSDAGITMTGDLMGTIRYMSPEQALAQHTTVDQRTDIYSLGATLYELLTLKPLFDGENRASLLHQIALEDPKPPRKIVPSLPRDLETIVLKALEKDPNDRYSSAHDLAADLQRYLDQRPIQARLPSLANRLQKWSRRHVGVVWTLVLAALALALALGVSTTLITASRNRAEQARSLLEDKSILLEEQRDRARENESFAHQLVYASDIRLAAQAWEDGDVRHYADLLDRHTQPTSGEDLRGFEWGYLRQLGTANPHTIVSESVGICSVRYSPDGKLIAAGRHDGKIQMIDGRNDRHLALLSGHVDLVRGIDFSPDSKRLASIGYGGVIRIWDLESFREIQTIQAFEEVHGYRVCFALGGKAVIAIAENAPAKLWDIESGKLMDAYGANGRGCWGLVVSPDGKTSAVRVGRIDFRIVEMNPRKNVAWMHFPLPHESAYCLRYSPDGRFIAAGTDKNKVRLYEARSGELVATYAGHDDIIWDVAFHPAGKILASCDGGGVIRTWQLESLGQPEVSAEESESNEIDIWPASFRGHAARTWSLDFSPDGKRLVSASRDGTVIAWTGREHPRQELAVSESVATDFSPSGDDLFIAKRKVIARWNRQTNQVYPFGDSFPVEAESLAVSPDGSIIATGHKDGTVRLWNRKTERIDRLLRGHKDEGVVHLAFSPDGTLLVTACWDGTGSLWEVASGKQSYVIEVPPHSESAAFAPDGQTFVLSQEDDFILYDVASGNRLHRLQGHKNSANCSAYSPNGRWLATGSSDRTIRIWDVRTGQTRHVIAAHREKIYALAFSPDGRTIATGDERGTLAFSHVETGRFLFDTKVTREEISHLSFSPDGKTLAVTCQDEQVVLLHAPESFDE